MTRHIGTLLAVRVVPTMRWRSQRTVKRLAAPSSLRAALRNECSEVPQHVRNVTLGMRLATNLSYDRVGEFVELPNAARHQVSLEYAGRYDGQHEDNPCCCERNVWRA